MAVLVTGGAGYVGSHLVEQMFDRGIDCVVLDNFETGHRAALPKVKIVKGDLRRRDDVKLLFERHEIDSVCHLAAYAFARESAAEPAKYYENNVCGAINLFAEMKEAGITRIVFSSSSAVYGNVKGSAKENSPLRPVSPYGVTKALVEQVLLSFAKAYGFAVVSLRYFNAAGASPSGRIGEVMGEHPRFIPVCLDNALGRSRYVLIYGTDYETPDGTCVRDYVHVSDVAGAHVAAMEKAEPGEHKIYNLGNEKGYSIREVIAAVETVTGKKLRVREAPREVGDPARIFASSAKARKELNWKPEFGDLESIIATAWEWFRKHPDGYKLL
ncbi:MAG: UDP-glucose 4-epimerase GalE [Planctomycetota bacterium]|nr:MAG: UDP-glucose 4-epimerase GalE [Planctomycetota bacterium]